MNRVLIVGPCGAGKSSLAQRLGPLLDLPVIHLDRLNWQPGWVMSPDDVFRARQMDVLRTPRWIIDGNYGASIHLRLPHADTVILLDFPRWRCMTRLARRIWRYAGETRPDMGDGCPERLDWEFMEFAWNWFAGSRARLLSRLRDLADDARLIVLRTPCDVDAFVDSLKQVENIS